MEQFLRRSSKWNGITMIPTGGMYWLPWAQQPQGLD
jgi:hypothetical protein